MNSYWEKELLLADLVNDKVISLDRGRVISSIDLYKKQGVYPVYSSSAQKNGLFGHFSEYDFDEEMITWSVDGGGYFFYRHKHKFSVTNVAGLLRILKPDYDYKFLFYCLDYQHSNQIYDYVDKAHPSVIKKRYFIPDISISEQQKIAEILTKMDDAIANTQAMIDKYENIKKGLMQDLLTKGIDEHGNIRSEETHKFKDSPLGRIPVEWEVQKLGEFISAIDPQPDHRTPIEVENGVPYIGISDVTKDGKIDFAKAKTVGVNVFAKQNKLFQIENGDLIFGKIGTIGKPTILPHYDNFRYTLSANVILIKPKIHSNFIYLTLLSHYVQNQILLSIHSTSQPAFGMKKIRDLLIMLPESNKDEMSKISNKINFIFEKISNLDKELNKLKWCKTALMQDLLSGKVRVPN